MLVGDQRTDFPSGPACSPPPRGLFLSHRGLAKFHDGPGSVLGGDRRPIFISEEPGVFPDLQALHISSSNPAVSRRWGSGVD